MKLIIGLPHGWVVPIAWVRRRTQMKMVDTANLESLADRYAFNFFLKVRCVLPLLLRCTRTHLSHGGAFQLLRLAIKKIRSSPYGLLPAGASFCLRLRPILFSRLLSGRSETTQKLGKSVALAFQHQMIQEQKLFYRLWVELRIAGSISPGSIGSQFNPFLPLGSKVRCSNTCYYIRVFSTKGTFVIVIVFIISVFAPLFSPLNSRKLGNGSVARRNNAIL